jgi:transcription elongation factor GreA
MTATLSPDARHDLLNARLADLYVEREQVLAEIAPSGSGDDADRATNVDGHVRLAMLEHRIVSVESELAEAPRERVSDGTVAIGDVVTLDLGDGPETYLLGSVEQAAAGVDVVTPTSPLGKVLQGAAVGSTVTYHPRPSRALQAKVISAS